MNTKSSIHKIAIPLLVIGVLLLTAFTVQAAAFKTAPSSGSGASISAQSVEKIGDLSPRLSIRGLRLSSTASETQLMDDKGNGSDDDLNEDENDAGHEITGTVTAVMSDSWMVGNVLVKIGAATEIDSGLGLGSVVKVEGEAQADGSFLAREIQAFDPNSNGEDHHDGDSSDDENENEGEDSADNSSAMEVEFTGVLTAINGSTWTVDGMTVLISASTEIKDNPQVGSLVKVEGTRESDSSIQAREVKLVSPDKGSDDEHDGTQISQDDQNTSLQNSGTSSGSGSDDHGGGGQDGGGNGGGGDDGSGHH